MTHLVKVNSIKGIVRNNSYEFFTISRFFYSKLSFLKEEDLLIVKSR